MVPAGVAQDVASNENSVVDFSFYFNIRAPKVVPIITPGTQDEEHNVLVIEKIEYFNNTKIQLVTLQGELIKVWENFENYADPSNSTQSDFNFMDLKQGSYIVIVDFVSPLSSIKEKVVEIIEVLK
jgi:hypothetical protein